MVAVFSFLNADLPALRLDLPVIFIAAPHAVRDLSLRTAQPAWVVQNLHPHSEILNAQPIKKIMRLS